MEKSLISLPELPSALRKHSFTFLPCSFLLSFCQHFLFLPSSQITSSLCLSSLSSTNIFNVFVPKTSFFYSISMSSWKSNKGFISDAIICCGNAELFNFSRCPRLWKIQFLSLKSVVVFLVSTKFNNSPLCSSTWHFALVFPLLF